MVKNINKKKGTVLVVDDEVCIQEILKSTLEDEGYECVTAGNADEAFSALAACRIDLVFTDIRMPGKRGTELLR
ncbi:MAG TPA: response regulator, partial [Acidobacteriota bacterium]|nr:response regulator [Acidobacteriota bacterium]